MTIWNALKNIFLLLVLLNVAPLLLENIKSQYRTYFVPNTRVAILPIKGSITDSTQYTKALTDYFEDDSIKAILFKIESSGGSCGSCQALFHEIIQLKKQYPKPVITLIENMCTAGGYYIASATDHLVASGTSIIGDIHVDHLCNIYDPAAVQKEDTSVVTKPMSPASHLSLDTYKQIVEDIAHQRKLPLNSLKDWAEGNVFTAREALSIGLIDQLGSIHTAIEVIKTKALIETEITWIQPTITSNKFGFLSGSSDADMLSNFANVLKLMILG